MWSVGAVLAKKSAALSLLAAAAAPRTPEQEAAYRIGYQIGVFFGAFVGGAIVGLLPLIVSLRKGRRTFAFASWASCIVANVLLGILLSAPLAVVLTVVVLCLGRQDKRDVVHSRDVEGVGNIYDAPPIPVPQHEGEVTAGL